MQDELEHENRANLRVVVSALVLASDVKAFALICDDLLVRLNDDRVEVLNAATNIRAHRVTAPQWQFVYLKNYSDITITNFVQRDNFVLVKTKTGYGPRSIWLNISGQRRVSFLN